MGEAMIRLLFLLLGAGVALGVSLNARQLGMWLGLLDYPDGKGGRKLHRHITPLVGGIGIVGAAVLASLLLIVADPSRVSPDILLWFLFLVVGMAILGAVDDRVELSPQLRLLLATLLIVVTVHQVGDFRVGTLYFAAQGSPMVLPGILGTAFTVLCLVGLLNAVNMADGKNGMVIGQAIVWSAILYFRLPPEMTPLILCLMGALLVLMWFNMRGRLFLGDGGSYGLSAIFGLLAIYAWNQGHSSMRSGDIALIFAVPVFDTIRLMIWRVLNGKSPFTPGRDHLHHLLFIRWGWPAPLSWVLMLVALPNLAAVAFPGTAPLWLAVTFVVYVLMLVVATSGSARRVA